MMEGMGMMVWGLFSFLLGLLLIFLLILAVVAGVKWIRGQKIPFVRENGESTLDLLKKRYAKGEINQDEFDRIKIAVHPKNPSKIFVGTDNGKIFLSKDGGISWRLQSNQLAQ